jgi:O-antigen/teichoic acid export membrane protein
VPLSTCLRRFTVIYQLQVIMKFKHIILSSIFWRSLYFVTVLLLNIILSRYLQAEGSGWIYYIINYFSFILLIASLNLEAGMAFYAAKKTIAENRLATLGLLWSIIVSILIVGVFFLNYQQPSHGLTKNQFVFFAGTYITGILLTTFFSSLFYAQQVFALPNLILAITNLLLIVAAPVTAYFVKGQHVQEVFLKLFFFNFLLQGILLSIAYAVKNNIFLKWALPRSIELTMLFRYSVVALMANIVFFLLYRIDYWFIKNTCHSCSDGDLGNYIQVSKLGQMFLLIPTFIASAIFPRTAAGFSQQVNSWLPVLVKAILICDLAALLFLVITGQWLFPWVYGETFNRMYTPFVLLIPGILCVSVIALMAAYNAGKDKVATNMKGGMIGLAVIVAGDWLLIPSYGIKAAAAVSSAGYASYLVYFMYVFKKEYHISIKAFFIPVADDWQKLRQIFSAGEGN